MKVTFTVSAALWAFKGTVASHKSNSNKILPITFTRHVLRSHPSVVFLWVGGFCMLRNVKLSLCCLIELHPFLFFCSHQRIFTSAQDPEF